PGGVELSLTWILGLAAGAFIIVGVYARLSRSTNPVLASLSSLPWYPLRSISGLYIWLFRGTPLLVQLAFVFFVVPSITNYQFTWIGTFGATRGPAWAAAIALSLNEGAYMSEIV